MNQRARTAIAMLIAIIPVMVLSFATAAASTAQEVSADSLLEFLSNEAAQHRAFIEQQEQTIIWMVGVIFGIATAYLCFNGWKTRKEVKCSIKEQYAGEIKKQVEAKLIEIIGSNDAVDLLHDITQQAKQMRQKRVLFVERQNDSAIKAISKWFIEKGFCRADAVADDTSLDISRLLQRLYEYDIIVYEPELTVDRRPNIADDRYRAVSDFCSRHMKNCVLHTGAAKIPDDVLPALDPVFVTTVNFPSKLRETLFTLLYMKA